MRFLALGDFSGEVSGLPAASFNMREAVGWPSEVSAWLVGTAGEGEATWRFCCLVEEKENHWEKWRKKKRNDGEWKDLVLVVFSFRDRMIWLVGR